MARANTADFLQNFRFHVSVVTGNGINPLGYADSDAETGLHVAGQAGFQSVSVPDITVEATEYREGTFKYTKKFPGPPTISDVSMMRGVTKNDTAFYNWALNTISGQTYRCDIEIKQFSRANYPQATGSLPNAAAAEYSATPGTSARSYVCHECVVTRAKPAGDLDATSGEVAMAECDFALEWFEVSVAAG
jgi:phage tail-like protein